MKKRNVASIEFNKFYVFLIVILIFIVILGYFLFDLYQDTLDNKTSEYDEIQSLALEDSEVTQINDIDRYHGDHLYYVMNVVAKNEDEMILFMHQEEEQWHYDTFKSDRFYTKEEILSEWQNRCSSCELLGSSIGIEDNNPLLEIKYLNESKQLVYEHVLLEDMSYYRLTLNPSF